MCSAWPQFEHTWMLMFSTMPSTGTETFSNILSPLRASARAMSCGVVTMTAPGNRHALRERQLDVAGAGRHVDDQIVELRPTGSRTGAA